MALCTCASTVSGFTASPQSNTATTLCTFTLLPSSDTSATCAQTLPNDSCPAIPRAPLGQRRAPARFRSRHVEHVQHTRLLGEQRAAVSDGILPGGCGELVHHR